MIKVQEVGEKAADVCRRHRISASTFYKYKSKYGGMEPSAAKRLQALEDENGKLKKLLAEQMLPSRALLHNALPAEEQHGCLRPKIWTQELRVELEEIWGSGQCGYH